jgi:hypothetical protein
LSCQPGQPEREMFHFISDNRKRERDPPGLNYGHSLT